MTCRAPGNLDNESRMTARNSDATSSAKKNGSPFRRAVLRGLGVLAPPLLTILIFIWAGSTINQYVLRPVTGSVRNGLIWATADIRTDLPLVRADDRIVSVENRLFRRMDDGTFVPSEVYDLVQKSPGDEPLPKMGRDVYRRYVEIKYLRPLYVVPFLLSIFLLVLYLLGKFMAAGIGRFFGNVLERVITRLPVVRSVYSGVKQVSDFMFNEREIEFTRVVAIEYPRKGIWSIGFVTSESFADIRCAANEPVLAVFIPCSPLPLTGYTVHCLRSECIDLNMTFDQACQFTISCGVVVPPQGAATTRSNGSDQAGPANGVAADCAETGG